MVSSVNGARIAAVKVPKIKSWTEVCLIGVSPILFQNIGISKAARIEEIRGYINIETIKNAIKASITPLFDSFFL